MRDTSRARVALALSYIAGAVPFVFALIRAVRTGSDLRYLWVAIAASAGAALGTMLAKSARTLTAPVVILCLSTAVGVLAAVLTGAAPGLPALIVGAFFSVCLTACGLLRRYSQRASVV